MTEYKGVMIFGEVFEGKLASITTELLGCGRKLAKDLGQELSAVLVGSNISNFATDLIGDRKIDPSTPQYQQDVISPIKEIINHKIFYYIINEQS